MQYKDCIRPSASLCESVAVGRKPEGTLPYQIFFGTICTLLKSDIGNQFGSVSRSNGSFI